MTLEIVKHEGERPLAPRESTFSRDFWSRLSAGEFSTTQCQVCKHTMFPPAQHCSVCWSKEMLWLTLSGKGKLYARTTVHAAPSIFQAQVPYSVGIIDLEEGIRIIASLIDGKDKLKNDEAIQLIVLSYDDGPLFAVRRM